MPAAPRADPYVKNYLIRLLPWVQRSRYNISTSRSRARRYLANPGTVSGARTCLAAFPLGDPLSSTDSAAGVPVLFIRFAGTMGPSDFPRACTPAVPPEAFSGRSNLPWHLGNSWDLPVLALGMSAHAQVLRLRRVRRCLAKSRLRRCCLLQVRIRSAHGSDDFGAQWLACVSSCRCHTRNVAIASVRFEARVTG